MTTVAEVLGTNTVVELLGMHTVVELFVELLVCRYGVTSWYICV